MKGGREHRVPLSGPAISGLHVMQVLRQDNDDYIFPGKRKGQPLNATALYLWLRRLRPGLTVHGFRSTFAQWAAETTSFPYEVREQALAHTIGTATERAYQRSDLFDRRRELMQQWADYCADPLAGLDDVL
jgi:integrase